MLRVALVAIALFFSIQLLAQSCCSGGVPLSNNIGLLPQNKGSWQLNWSYDLNTLNTLKAGTEVLDDNSRRRQTHSALFQLGYTFSERWSAEFFISYIRQERRIRQFGREDFTFTQGLGDAVALVKYQLLPHQDQDFLVGLGIKAPTGPSDLLSSQGLRLNADLQPGSGAWDALVWIQYSASLSFRPSLSWSLTGTYTAKGTNNEYLGNQAYRFGQELQFITSLADQLLVAGQIIGPSLSFRFRHVASDLQNDEKVPGTGGIWLFARPGLAWSLTPVLNISAGIELPLFADLVDTQVTPTHRIQLGLSWLLSK